MSHGHPLSLFLLVYACRSWHTGIHLPLQFLIMNTHVRRDNSSRLGWTTRFAYLFRLHSCPFRIVERWSKDVQPTFSACCLFAALVCLGYAQLLWALYFFALWALSCPHQLWFRSTGQRAKSKHRRPLQLSLAGVAGLTSALFLSSAWFVPAHAQFLQSAEQAATQLTSGLGGGTDISPVITFIFGALRLLLIVYMAVALIQIVNSARQGEEWKDLARTPLLIILVVIIGDFIATIVVGGGGAAV